MVRLFVLCVILGGLLLIGGARRLKKARQQGLTLILLGVLLNAWWLVFLAMDLTKKSWRVKVR